MRDYRKLTFLTLATGSLLLTSAIQAANLTADSLTPVVDFIDTTEGNTESTWALVGDFSAFSLADTRNNDVDGKQIFQFRPVEENVRSLMVDLSGDISLADESVFIDRSTGTVGIGTNTPGSEFLNEARIHVKSPAGSAGIISETSTSTWGTFQYSDRRVTGRFSPTRADVIQLFNDAPTNSIVATEIGVGIGDQTPSSKLEVAGDIKATFDGSSDKNLQPLFIMSANNTDSGKKSDVGFVVTNARENFSYAFRTMETFTRPGETVEIDGGFAMSKQGTGEQELVLINPTTDDPEAVELYLSNGASNVNGQWVNASSRSYKKNIHDLSGADAMQAMRELKSVSYEFKRDAGKEKMIGFIAEDVPELLATKTRKTVDTLRIVAVLTKAMQEQDKSLVSKDRKIAEMEARAEKNTSRLEKLEAQLMKLLMK